jgi:class 3 adenylate cyclase
LGLRHRAVLSLARSGATAQAEQAFSDLQLSDESSAEIVALAARLAKDRALTAVGYEPVALRRAAALYLRSCDGVDDYYPLINAATLSLLAGDPERSRVLAEAARSACEQSRPDTPERNYYVYATKAEAAVLLGDPDAAHAWLQAGKSALPDDHAAHASTRKQLRLVCSKAGVDAKLLSALEPAPIFHISATPHGEIDREAIESLSRQRIAFAFAGLATPNEVVVAEALLSLGAALHVVLPYEPHEVRRMVMDPMGGSWSARFDHCIAQASAYTAATTDGELGDELVSRYADDLAMGLACLRARHLDGIATQLVLARDEMPPAAARWRTLGRVQHVVKLRPSESAVAQGRAAPPDQAHVLKSMLFGDIKGFSKLRETDIPAFLGVAMAALADVLARYDHEIRWRNTWGDGLYVVIDTPIAAARCALELQAALDPARLEAVGLGGLALRLAAHEGPVLECMDPVLGKTVYFGNHVNRTARIEPVAPPGAVYVTEQLAATLELEQAGMNCDYVGLMPTAKNFGAFRMYSLRAAQ